MPRVTAVVLLALLALPAPAARAQDPQPATPCEVQGSGTSSPLSGRSVRVAGVVTGAFVGTDIDGFFLQAPGCDADPATSDALWVFDGNRDVTVVEGQAVVVVGKAAEHFGLTELVLDHLEAPGPEPAPAVAPEPLPALPQDPAAAAPILERLEGMLVALPEARVVGATNGFGETYVVTSPDAPRRLFRNTPDGRRLGVVANGQWLRADHGARLSAVVGNLNYTFDNWKVAVPDPAAVTIALDPALRPDAFAPAAAGELTLASYNLENFFDPVDDPQVNDTEWTPSAEVYAEHLAARAESIAKGLGAPHVVGLAEIENLRVLQDLVAHPTLAPFGYRAALIEGIDERGIDSGLIYRADKVELLSLRQGQGCVAESISDPGVRCALPGGGEGSLAFSRPPLVARLQLRGTRRRLTVIANHFKSKSGGEAATLPIRVAQAGVVLGLVEELHRLEPSTAVFVTGDLNDFEDSEPLARLTGTDKLKDCHLDRAMGSAESRYSFIFNGVSQVLDFILAPPGLELKECRPVHLNDDFGFEEGGAVRLVLGRHTRVSDHDPIGVRLSLEEVPEIDAQIFLPLAGKVMARSDLMEDAPPAPSPTVTMPIPASPIPTGVHPTATAPRSGSGADIEIRSIFYNGAEGRAEPDEYVEIANISNGSKDLEGWTLLSITGTGDTDQTFNFPVGFQMTAGQVCRIYTDQDHPEHCGLNWGVRQAIWNNGGDEAKLFDDAGALVDHYCYGSRVENCG